MSLQTNWKPLGYARFSTLSSAITLGTATPAAGTAANALTDSFGRLAQPLHAIIDVENQSIRVRDDGTNPTASEGQLVRVATQMFIDGPDAILNLRIIEANASAQITVRYYL